MADAVSHPRVTPSQPARRGGRVSTVHTGLLPRATTPELLGILAGIIGPTLAKGVIIRRPYMVALAEWLDLDRRAVRRMQRLRDKYVQGPLLLGPVWERYYALLLSPAHVKRVLDDSPDPFATASSEKIAALSHFEPKGVLISHGRERADRRRFNEAILDTGHPHHRLAARFVEVVDDEARRLLAAARRVGELRWHEFAQAWFSVVRRVVFGDGARDDHEVTDLIARLRSYGNWAFLSQPRVDLRNRFFDRLNAYLRAAEPGSLAGVMASTPATHETAPSHQVPQWLFAFDPAGMTTFRTLALLASHPTHAGRARQEIREHPDPTAHERPFLRACVLESLRLWPTTPLILRQSTDVTTWDAGRMPAQTGVIIYTPFFHRDDQRLPCADRLSPEIWLQDRPPEHAALVPFSDGPARCPGRDLVLLVTSAMVGALIKDREIRLKPATRLEPDRPLPGTLNNYSLRFAISG